MKRISVMILVALIAAVLCMGLTAEAEAKKKFTQIQKVSYGIGFSIAKKMMADNLENIDYDLLLKGMKDAYANAAPTVPENEMREAFAAQKAIKMEAQKKQGAVNLKKAEDFLKKNASQKGVKVLEKGLQYKVLKSGSGKSPQLNNDVILHYKGMNFDGKEFDSSYKRGKPATMKPNGLIPGFRKALAKMKEGDKWLVYIHPDLAYRLNSPNPDIRPNEMLTFEIEVIEAK